MMGFRNANAKKHTYTEIDNYEAIDRKQYLNGKIIIYVVQNSKILKFSIVKKQYSTWGLCGLNLKIAQR